MTDTGSREVPLHPLERSLLLFLSQEEHRDKWLDVNTVAGESKLSIDQVRRAIEWMKAKNLIEVEEEETIRYSLGEEGEKALREGLPERKLVRMLESSQGETSMQSLSASLGSEFSVAFGRAKKNNWIELVNGSTIRLNSSNSANEEPEEIILRKIGSNEETSLQKISGNKEPEGKQQDQEQIIRSLMKRHRGLVEERIEKSVRLKLSSLGLELSGTINKDEIDEITPEVIRSEAWRTRPLRAIDVTSPAPNFFAGRKHPVRMFIDEVKEVLVSMGFEEIEGTMVQSALWNFDALFIPQQHSTREMQDTFYLSDLKADLSKYSKEASMIKGSHEHGEGTGSLGWQYDWSEEEARRVVLRTHTTALTIRYLAQYKPTEARVFSVGKVFRNEKPNYKHNPEFYQIEGVTVGPKLNVRNMIYIISKFYAKLGFERVKFWPTYFPYTEPSLQTVVYMEKKGKWMELGGMGVFRPEVTVPLGVTNPVLAWGLGLDRLVMMRYNLEDIRDLFGANLGWLRKTGVL